MVYSLLVVGFEQGSHPKEYLQRCHFSVDVIVGVYSDSLLGSSITKTNPLNSKPLMQG